jgi:hypothetical protein
MSHRDAHDGNFTNYSEDLGGITGGTGFGAAVLAPAFGYVETPMLIRKKLNPLRREAKILMRKSLSW